MMMTSLRESAPLRRLFLPLLTVVALSALAGCGIFSPDESDDGGDDKIVVDFKPPYVDDGAQGRNQLIDNLELAYEEMNYSEYEKLLHPDYVFRVAPTEVDIVGFAELSIFEDLSSTEAMFGGGFGEEPIIGPDGQPTGDTQQVPPVQEIRLTLTPAAASNWTLMEDGEYAGSWRRTYEVDMRVIYSGDSGRVDEITSQQLFFVIPGTVAAGETVLEVWQLRAWEDQLTG